MVGKRIPTFPTEKPIATRNAGAPVQSIENVVPELLAALI
jgi:hypothetical protein